MAMLKKVKFSKNSVQQLQHLVDVPWPGDDFLLT